MSAYLTVAQAAVLAGRHPVTLRKALEAAELHGFQRKVGGRWSIAEECVTAWVECRPCAHKTSNVTPIRRSRTA